MKNKIMKGASFLTAVLMFSMVLTPLVAAAPPQPHNRWGVATGPAVGNYVSAWVDGVEYGAAQVIAGNWYDVNGAGDWTDTPLLKEGGAGDGIAGPLPDDEIYWVHSTAIPALTTANGGTLFQQSAVFESGYLYTTPGGEALTEVASMPALLKINNVSTQSNLAAPYPAVNDYVVIYNPTGSPVDSNNYVLEAGASSVNCGGNIVAGQDGWNVANIPAGGYLAVNAAGLAINANDAITLRHTGDSHFIVDRVEYGTINVIPDETIMVNGPATTAGNEIARSAGADTNDCNADFSPKGAWLYSTGGGPGTITYWDLSNGFNYRTFTSDLNPGWTAQALALDIISYMNTNYGEALTDYDVSILGYDGSYYKCYRTAFGWTGDFLLALDVGYILEVSSLVAPNQYELPNFQFSTFVTIDLFNDYNHRGIPVTTAGDAQTLCLDIISYMNVQYGEALTDYDVSLIGYDGSYYKCYRTAFGWTGSFALDPQMCYIVEVTSLSSTPRAYVPS